MSTALNYTNATQLLEQGNTKDAYVAFLSIVELTTQQLHAVKFVHQTIVSKPLEYENSLALLRSSIDQLENIAVKKLPGAINNGSKKSSSSSSPPPPLPPKPTSMYQRPTVPPKPSRIITSPIPSKKSIDTLSSVTKRSRGNSVSFAQDSKLFKTAIIEYEETPTSIVNQLDDEDDDDEDDVVIEFENTAKVSTKRPLTALPPNNISSPQVRARSQSWVVPSDSLTNNDEIDVLSETVVDPGNLVPAQTNTGDSLALPTTSQVNSYVPNIPAPPLLATHRRLQQRLNELEADLEKFRPLDILVRSERLHKISSTRETLEKVRSLYMSAMTIPSILQFPPHLIAYQLTLTESSLFRAIPLEALLSHSARTPHKKIVASTDFFNFVTRTIEHSILLPQEASKRAEIINRWIKIAAKLLALNNYQTLKAIVSALGTPPVQRLRRTWECIPKKRVTRLDLLNNLMSETDNYCRYREHMGLEKRRLWSKPVVPFLGVFIHDITYLSCASKGRAQDVLSVVQLFQRAPEYPQTPPASYMASKKHLFRPMISEALHFGSSKKNNKVTTAVLMGEDQREDIEIELEQQLIVQYLLMRPWVSEKAIDALSNLREPPKPRSTPSPTSHRFSSDLGLRPVNNIAIPPITATRVNSNTEAENPATVEESKRSIVGGFWPFKKNLDVSRASLTTDYHQWSEEDDEDDDDDEEEEIVNQLDSKHGVLDTRRRPVTINTGKSLKGHSRSISLPSKSIIVSEM
ncbi:ras guanine nucleotide exchange factor domain-containing protein [Gilbertella persicaria]|uniref:Ras-specific guanine nucleotide-releasing factor RalGPS1 n=1 Tax=Rhizopus stolonifer TaxID=4846 RepID=A0A367KVJ9_RHIST|nr:ras guanine nucleotide exchange factor domain-containing protein [Gilbertella persicaria]KAI8085792.1 ras guanine nucleotide exchange factor domain-containing protein [Gilbertella persicaria]RCI06226.1 Ras-specific guanine nucleotide-releasing factor RalGPS1 [Rhizopus stolonifer]